MSEPAIVIERSPEFEATAREIGNHISTLLLTNEQNNQLVELLIKQITEAESTAFRQGFSMGVELGRYFAENPEDAPLTMKSIQ